VTGLSTGSALRSAARERGEGMGWLHGKVAVVTGGASGIGRATAQRCATEGARVIIADVTDAGALLGADRVPLPDVTFQRTDVTVAADVAAVMRQAVVLWGRLDILVCAAGIGGGSRATADYPDTDFDRVIAVNLKGVFLCMKHAIAEMLRGGGGAIVNIASVTGLVGLPFTPAYSAAKGGVMQLSKVAALEYANRNIRVNCVCPGMIDTPLVQRIPTGARAQFLERQPLSRLGTAEEVAAAVVFLASEASAFTTGAALVVDGGFTAQ
jgi:NAD(P)-dependent dehydrogenase (short-subunit alcohol dehydrogenase family)